MWTPERVRQLLLEIAGTLPPDRRRVAAAWLGTQLIALDPEFRANVLGDVSLKWLLARFPDVGTWIAEGTGAFEFANRALEPADVLQRDSRGSPAESDRDRHTGPTMPASAQPPSPRLRQEFWSAMTAPSPSAPRYVDLVSCSVVGSAEAAVEPERFVQIASLSADDVRKCAERFADSVKPELRDGLLAALGDSRGVSDFVRIVGDAGLMPAWREAHRAMVVQHAKSWTAKHRIPFERLLERPGARGSTRNLPRSGQMSRGTGIADDVRARLHAVIDRMSEQDLLELRIPAKYLLV